MVLYCIVLYVYIRSHIVLRRPELRGFAPTWSAGRSVMSKWCAAFQLYLPTELIQAHYTNLNLWLWSLFEPYGFCSWSLHWTFWPGPLGLTPNRVLTSNSPADLDKLLLKCLPLSSLNCTNNSQNDLLTIVLSHIHLTLARVSLLSMA